MKTLIGILIISSFIQTTTVPINLVLIILISRALIRPEKNNLLLAFSFGLLISHLKLQLIGFDSLIYLLLVQITQTLAKSRISAHPFFIFPLILIYSLVVITAQSFLLAQSTRLIPQIFLDSLASLPIFYLIKIWEERFRVRNEIRLRL